MLHYNRTLAVKKKDTDFAERAGWKMWKLAMTHRGMMDVAGAQLKTKVVNSIFKNSWGKRRDGLEFQKSFKQMMEEKGKY